MKIIRDGIPQKQKRITKSKYLQKFRKLNFTFGREKKKFIQPRRKNGRFMKLKKGKRKEEKTLI